MFLCADLDAFFASVEQVLNPGLIAKPVIVGGLPKERGVVASASYEARKFGIHSGMPTAHAYRLCPHAIFLRGNFEHYRWFSGRFYKILCSFSPDINMASIDEAYVNIKGTKRLFGSQLVLAKRLKYEIKTKLNIPVSIGIALSKFHYDGLQPSIFDIKQRRLNQLNHALDKVRNKFGFNSLYPANTSIIRNKELR